MVSSALFPLIIERRNPENAWGFNLNKLGIYCSIYLNSGWPAKQMRIIKMIKKSQVDGTCYKDFEPNIM